MAHSTLVHGTIRLVMMILFGALLLNAQPALATSPEASDSLAAYANPTEPPDEPDPEPAVDPVPEDIIDCPESKDCKPPDEPPHDPPDVGEPCFMCPREACTEDDPGSGGPDCDNPGGGSNADPKIELHGDSASEGAVGLRIQENEQANVTKNPAPEGKSERQPLPNVIYNKGKAMGKISKAVYRFLIELIADEAGPKHPKEDLKPRPAQTEPAPPKGPPPPPPTR